MACGDVPRALLVQLAGLEHEAAADWEAAGGGEGGGDALHSPAGAFDSAFDPTARRPHFDSPAPSFVEPRPLALRPRPVNAVLDFDAVALPAAAQPDVAPWKGQHGVSRSAELAGPAAGATEQARIELLIRETARSNLEARRGH